MKRLLLTTLSFLVLFAFGDAAQADETRLVLFGSYCEQNPYTPQCEFCQQQPNSPKCEICRINPSDPTCRSRARTYHQIQSGFAIPGLPEVAPVYLEMAAPSAAELVKVKYRDGLGIIGLATDAIGVTNPTTGVMEQLRVFSGSEIPGELSDFEVTLTGYTLLTEDGGIYAYDESDDTVRPLIPGGWAQHAAHLIPDLQSGGWLVQARKTFSYNVYLVSSAGAVKQGVGTPIPEAFVAVSHGLSASGQNDAAIAMERGGTLFALDPQGGLSALAQIPGPVRPPRSASTLRVRPSCTRWTAGAFCGSSTCARVRRPLSPVLLPLPRVAPIWCDPASRPTWRYVSPHPVVQVMSG